MSASKKKTYENRPWRLNCFVAISKHCDLTAVLYLELN